MDANRGAHTAPRIAALIVIKARCEAAVEDNAEDAPVGRSPRGLNTEGFTRAILIWVGLRRMFIDTSPST